MDIAINPGQTSGFYSLSSTITDTAGNASGHSDLINIYKDLPAIAATAPGTPDMDPLYDFGTSSSDNLTRETQPRFTISCTS